MHRRSAQEVATHQEIAIRAIRRRDRDGPYECVDIETDRGVIRTRYVPAPGEGEAAVLMVGGAGGGFDTPVRGSLYPDLCKALPAEGISCLWVSYRRANDLVEGSLDVLCGIEFLLQEGRTRMGLVGWSFGGAVAVQAAALSDAVLALATIATQSYGIEPISRLGPRCGVLLLHGGADTTLPVRCSQYAHSIASEPRKLIVHPPSNHGLDQWGEEVRTILVDWMRTRLR